MNFSAPPARSWFGLSLSIGVSALILIGPASAFGQHQHRARVARSLDAKLSQGAAGTHESIILTPQAEVDRIVASYGVRVVKRLDLGALISGSAWALDAVARDANVSALAANDVVTSTMAVSTQATGASQLWQARGSSSHFGGLTGLGVGVAIIDSGVAAHPDIDGHVTYRKDFTNEGLEDAFGHGTHVAATVAGNGAGSRSGSGSMYVGMAPGAEIISLKVLGADGNGYVADVIAAIDWCIRNMARFNIRVINLSLGHLPTSAPQDDPMAQAVERAVDAGLVVVSSAGNRGKNEQGEPVIGLVVSPGFTPGALTVGALNTKGTVERSDDTIATYSSRGPVGDPNDSSTWQIKPDVVAPGNAIVAAGASDSYLWKNFPSRQVTGASGGTYLTLSGASMATAVVSGAVAQLLQLQPALTPAEVKFALQYTAGEVAGFDLIAQGAGSINVPLAAELIRTRVVDAAPTTNIIGSESVAASQIAFAETFVWGSRGGPVSGDTFVWGARGGPVGGNTFVWGSKGGPVGGDTFVWGARGGPVGGDTFVWGAKGGPVSGDTFVWGAKGGPVSGDTFVWGARGGPVGGDTFVWGAKGGPVSGDTFVWGARGGPVGGDTFVWGAKGGPVSGDTFVWGARGGPVGSDTFVWGAKDGPVSGDTFVWGARGGPVGGDTFVWGAKGGPVTGDTFVWGARGGPVGGDTFVWGAKGGPVSGDTFVWGARGGPVGGDTFVWGAKGGPVTGDTFVWGARGGPVGGDTFVWGAKGGPVTGDTFVWGARGGPVGGDTFVWGAKGGPVTGNTFVWGARGGPVGGDTFVWGAKAGPVTGNTFVWGARGGPVGGDTFVWGAKAGPVAGNTFVWGARDGTVGGDTFVWGARDVSSVGTGQ